MASTGHARADVAERLSLRSELGAGTTLSEDLRDRDLNVALQGSVKPGFALVDFLVIQAAFSHWAFPRSDVWGRATLIGGGLRIEPSLGSRLRLMIDGDAGVGYTGDANRFMFDAGVGLDWEPSRIVGLGPLARYGQLTTGSANFWSAGVGLTLRVPTEERRIAEKPRPPPRAPATAAPKTEPPSPAPPPPPAPEPCDCSPKDDDADRIPNDVDECPAVAAGLNPDAARLGCPKPDADGDSVPDDVDACPNEPGAPQQDAQKNGCPGLVAIKAGDIQTLKPVYFQTGKDAIRPQSFPVLKAVADAVKATPTLRLLSIEGHADAVGSEAFNLDLSKRRAASVMKYLVDQGVEPSRLALHGYGKSKPVESNITEAGRALNRRVEFHIVDAPEHSSAPPNP